jgi:hypothetical protein
MMVSAGKKHMLDALHLVRFAVDFKKVEMTIIAIIMFELASLLFQGKKHMLDALHLDALMDA